MTNYLQTDFDLDSDKVVEVFDELNIWAAPFGLKLLDNIRYQKNITALDIGFGAGFPLTEIAMRLGNSCKVYGLDPWNAGILRAQKKIEIYGINNIEIIHGFAEEISLQDKSVDLITSNNGLNNVADFDRSLSECSRVMKKGGQFIQTLNLNDSLIEFYAALETVLMDEKMDASIRKIDEQIYSKRKPLDEITGLIEKHNFAIEKVINDQFEYRFTDGTSMLNHYFIRLAFLDGWKSILPSHRQTEIFEKIETCLNAKAANDGSISLTIPYVLIDSVRK
jgi:arsenite methyltransferase